MSRGETLKSRRPVSLAGYQLPAAPSATGRGLDKPKPSERTPMSTAIETPAKPAGALYYPTPVTPEEAFQAIGRLRKDARDEIDRLIQFLDKTDNYVSRELEDSVDDNPQHDDSELEPSLCGVTAETKRAEGVDDDLEGDDTPSGRSAELEPSLGSIGVNEWSNQTRWAGGSSKDLEDEHDGAEDDHEGDSNENDEPSLGWGIDGP